MCMREPTRASACSRRRRTRPLIGVVDVDPLVEADAQAELNPEGVNVVRVLSRPRHSPLGRADAELVRTNGATINVRRLFLTLRRWLDSNTTFVGVRARYGPRLWMRIRRELTVYLTDLWLDGALAGSTPDGSVLREVRRGDQSAGRP